MCHRTGVCEVCTLEGMFACVPLWLLCVCFCESVCESGVLLRICVFDCVCVCVSISMCMYVYQCVFGVNLCVWA